MPIPERRYSKRSPRKRRASLILELKRQPCLVLDSSNDGFRVRGAFQLRRGKAGSKQEGEVGLETV